MKKKKVILSGIVVIAILISIFLFIFLSSKKEASYQTITSTDHRFSLQIPSDRNYKINTKEDSTFTLDFYSVSDEMYCYASTIKKQREVNLLDLVNEDKTSYLADKENIRDDSGIQEIKLKDYKTYEYTLTYYDSSYGKDFYADVVWIETENYLYILNFEVIHANQKIYQEIFFKMKNSFTENIDLSEQI